MLRLSGWWASYCVIRKLHLFFYITSLPHFLRVCQRTHLNMCSNLSDHFTDVLFPVPSKTFERSFLQMHCAMLSTLFSVSLFSLVKHKRLLDNIHQSVR